ncbi:MAG: peptidoglycan-binding protein [Gammaproteobacteria bacterium TMED1]|nr:MAG: peptidoglycan-binding protein [Gammaproteobacteria bacterium TMED1]|tara:strand:+ start:1345 stop:2949 length:1605 start_codon:yes stop_codon:yes gene_type:complete
MYEEHFSLTSTPFSIAPDPQFLYMSARHREALAHLIYGVENNGLVLLTGEVGTGKTTICRYLLNDLPDNVDTAFIINPKVTETELLSSICDDLGILYPQKATLKVLIDRLNTHLLDTLKKDKRTLVIIDEAQNLSVDVLEQLRLLTNLETNQRKLLQIILLGQPELLGTLSGRSLRQLSQRITARYHLDALDKNETRQYIAYRLATAGAKVTIFQRSAMDSIYRLSKGIPRVINLICDRCLLGAFAENQSFVSSRIVKAVSKELFLDRPIYSHLAGTVICCLAGLVVFVSLFTYLPFTVYSHNNDTEIQLTKGRAVTNNPQDAAVTIPISKVSGHIDKGLAFTDLHALWGIYINNRTLPACEAIIPIGLACLELLGSIEDIVKLNRPTIIQASINSGWVTISALSENNATLIAHDREYLVSRKELDQLSNSLFTVIWRMPPGYKKPISLGDKGADVDWLIYQLSILYEYPYEKTTGHVFDRETRKKVMDFQKSVNLPVSGIVGPRSWIFINSIEGINIPVLYQEESRRTMVGEN